MTFDIVDLVVCIAGLGLALAIIGECAYRKWG